MNLRNVSRYLVLGFLLFASTKSFSMDNSEELRNPLLDHNGSSDSVIVDIDGIEMRNLARNPLSPETPSSTEYTTSPDSGNSGAARPGDIEEAGQGAEEMGDEEQTIGKNLNQEFDNAVAQMDTATQSRIRGCLANVFNKVCYCIIPYPTFL